MHSLKKILKTDPVKSCLQTLLHIYIIVLAWVLIPHPLANHNPAISSVTQALKILTTPPQADKKPL